MGRKAGVKSLLYCTLHYAYLWVLLLWVLLLKFAYFHRLGKSDHAFYHFLSLFSPWFELSLLLDLPPPHLPHLFLPFQFSNLLQFPHPSILPSIKLVLDTVQSLTNRIISHFGFSPILLNFSFSDLPNFLFNMFILIGDEFLSDLSGKIGDICRLGPIFYPCC